MLTDLRVRDLGVIGDLTLRLGPGLTALTGETGAGKTLLVEALHLVLGGRATSGLVRGGAEGALVQARFVTHTDGDPEDGHELVLTRELPAAGRSRAWVDDRLVPVASLAEVAAGLVDIHGQHEHQALLSAAAQRRALDRFAGTDLAPLVAARTRLKEIEERLAAVGGDERQRAREADLLRHQVAEIAGARIEDPDEEAVLLAEEERLADLGAHRDAAARALESLDGGEGGGALAGGSALERVSDAGAALADRTPFAPWSARLRAVQAELGDVASDLRTVVESWEDDPERLAEIQSRRRSLADLRRKYGDDLRQVVAFGEAAARQLADLEGAERTAARLAAERQAVMAELAEAEVAVHKARAEAAPELSARVTGRLESLAMAGARLEVMVAPVGDGDPVQFALAANPGEPLQPLARVASGGELARTMLALRLVAMEGPATMVFDEVDAGVGGSAALALARALREASAGRQVLVVTHLAQVAAFADHQVAVGKRRHEGRTVTGAAVLGDEDRVVELARMLSGHPDSATAQAHARELLALGRAPGPSTPGDGAVV